MDAAVVKLLNSTFGTTDYKPLDEIILKGSKRLTASANDFLTIPINTISVSTSYGSQMAGSAIVDIAKVKSLVGGTARVVADIGLKDSSGGFYATGYIYVYVNGTLKYTFSKSSTIDGIGEEVYAVMGDIMFSADDEISFKMKVNASAENEYSYATMRLYNIRLHATVLDNIIEVIV